MLLQVYRVILTHGIFSGSFRQLRMTSFHKITVAEKKNSSSTALHNFAKSKVISKCKNDKPKN